MSYSPIYIYIYCTVIGTTRRAESSNNTVRTITEDVETAVATVWERSRRWSFLATTKKRRVHCWRLVALVCSVAGALCQATARCFPQDTRILATQNVLNFVGACLLAVAPYLITSFCGRDKVRDWIRCRAAADDLQSHTYLYRMGVQPYDHPPEKKEDGALHTFLTNMAIISESVQDMNHEYIVTYQNNNTTMNTIDDDTTTLTPPPANLDRESYLHDRIDHQIHHHYIHAATIYATRSRYLHRGMATLSFLAATVGFITGYVPPLKNYVGLSTALTLAATSIGTHIAASGYDSRAETLSTSALHLETLRLGLPHSVHVGSTEWRTFVVQCEQHMASTTRRVGAAANVTTLQRLDSTSHRPNTSPHSRLTKVE